MNQSQKIGLWSIVGLVGSLLIAWYFSRKQIATRGNTSDYNPPADNGMNQYTFNIPPLTIPQISVTIPPPAVIPGSGSGAPAPSGCGCNPCGGTGYVSGSDALNTAIQNSQNWNTLVQNTTAPKKTTPIKSNSPRPYEPLVLDDPNYPGHANPNPYLYSHDPIYKMAYDNAVRTWTESHQRSQMTSHDIFISLHMETGYALQEIQQYLFLYGDDPNANAVKPVSLH